MSEIARPVDIQDAITYRIPSDARISPDGSRVVFSLGWASKTGEHPVADLWIVPTEGGAPRRLTTGDSYDIAPRWSPDGTTIAFISDRASRGTGALFLMDPDGGEAQRLSKWDAAVADPQWSPDGRRITLLATDPQDDEEKRRTDDRDDPLVVDERLKFDRLAVIELPADLAEITPAAPARLLEGDRHVWEQLWSPDGGRLAAVISQRPGFGESFAGLRVVLVPAAGGEPVYVGGESGTYRSANSLAWSPDGSRLTFIGGVELDHSDTGGIWIVDVAQPAHADLRFRDESGTPDALAWPHADWIALHRLVGTTAGLWKLPVAGGEPLPALTGEQAERGSFASGAWATDISGAFSRGGERFAAAWGDATRPRELWAGVVGGTARQLTSFNAGLASRSFGRTEAVSWTASDGTRIEGLLIYPLDYVAGQRYPTILHTHGGPTGAWNDHLYAGWHDWGQLLAANGYAVLLPNPRGSTGRGWRFALGNLHDLMGGDWSDSQAGLDALIERGIADPERLGAGGWSYGGYTTAWTITQTSRFKAAVVGAGASNRTSGAGTTDIIRWLQSWFRSDFTENPDEYWERSPVRYVGAATTPTLILHGEKDDRVPLSQSYELYNALKTLGVPARLVVYPRQPHTIAERNHQRDILERVVAWFDEYVK